MLNTITFIVAALATICNALSKSDCRCFPGDSCWPTDDDWSAFNKSIGGGLIRTIPLGSVCHDPQYDEAACKALQAVWTNPDTHYKTSHSIMSALYANQSCDPFTPQAAQCVIGTYVQYAVNASNPAHISKSVKFAQDKNIRLVIRNTGHDYLGKSTGAGALAIWTHNMKSFAKLHWADDHYAGPAIRMGSGIQGFEAVNLAGTHGLVVASGYCPTVGPAGGYLQGGGHGPLASLFGLAADNALEFEVTDGLGQGLVANRHRNTDLFWALSGGGGGTYGVVTSVTVKAHTTMPVTAVSLLFSNEDISGDVFREAIATFQTVVPDLVNKGCYPLWLILNNNSFFLRDLMAPGLSPDQVEELLKPFLDFLSTNSIQYQKNTTSYATYDDYYTNGGPSSFLTGQSNVIQLGNSMLPRSIVATPDQNNRFIDAVMNITAQGARVGLVGFNVSKKVAGDVYNAVLPGWRDTSIYANVLVPESFNETLQVGYERREDMERNMLSQLRTLAGESNTYLNEANPADPNWKLDFYGSNYDKLLAIKKKYDPNHLFYSVTAVGSDYWVEMDDKRLCKNEGYSN